MIDRARYASLAAIQRERTKREGLPYFLRTFWPLVSNDGGPFDEQFGWAIDKIAYNLMALHYREIRNLVVNAPPGCGKSTVISVLFPVWVWTVDPKHPLMVTSYGHDLVTTWAEKRATLLDHEDFRSTWPEIGYKRRGRIMQMKNAKGGTHHSLALEGGGTGKHVLTQIIDDPMKAQDRYSPIVRAKTHDVWHGALASRCPQNKAEYFRRIVNQQRLGSDDLSASCLARGDYEHVCIPLRYPGPVCFWDRGSTLEYSDPRTVLGQPMGTEVAAAAIESRLEDPRDRAAQLDQNPLPDKGGVIEKAWLLRWSDLGDLNKLRWFQSWDFGFKGKDAGHSRVVGGLFAASHDRCYLVDMTKPEPLNYPASKTLIKSVQKNPLWARARLILIEDKANGTPIMADLAEEIPGMYPVEPKGSKAERLYRHSDAIKAGAFFLPPSSACAHADVAAAELVGFPLAAHDDIVDIVTQALDNAFGGAVNYWQNVREAAKNWEPSHDVD